MNKLQGKNIKIFQIIGKKFSDHSFIEFSLNKSVPHLQQITTNKVYLVNEPPFTNYKVGDFLGIIDVDRTSLRFSNAKQDKIWKDSAVVAKVVKSENAIPSNHEAVYNREEFGDGWAKE